MQTSFLVHFSGLENQSKHCSSKTGRGQRRYYFHHRWSGRRSSGCLDCLPGGNLSQMKAVAHLMGQMDRRLENISNSVYRGFVSVFSRLNFFGLKVYEVLPFSELSQSEARKEPEDHSAWTGAQKLRETVFCFFFC